MTLFTRRLVLSICSLFAAGAATGAAAAEYPSRPITIVFPYAVGSASDTLARQVGEILTKALGQPVVVDPRPGAGGSTALEYASKAAPDGYTLVLTGTGTMAVNPHIYNLRHRPVDSLKSITILTEIPFIVVTNRDLPVKDLKDFISYAKARPGEVSFGNAGIGTQAHLTQMMFLKAAGITANVVAYKGGPPATTDLLGGHINAMIDNAASQTENVRAQRVRPLFVTTQVRSPSMPNVPTADEAGLPGFVTSGWFGLAAPKDTPTAIVDRLQAAVAKGFAQPDIRKRLLEAGWIPVANLPAEADARARADLIRFERVAADLQLKPN